MSKPIQYRQGDVLLRRLPQAPTFVGRVLEFGERIILAEGELTGHFHSVDARYATLHELPEGKHVLEVCDPVALEHQEHSPIPLCRGHYEVIRQREYDPEEVRRVQD